jgi:AraC-like DNA-binding protein
MERSPKSNMDRPHIMSPSQLARRFECSGSDIGIPGLTTVGRYRYTAAYEHLRTQSHPDELLICFLARGRQTYRANHLLHHLRGGDHYIVFPGEPHDSAGFPEEKGELYWLGLRIRRTRQPLLCLDAAASTALRQSLLELPSRHFTAPPETRTLFEELIQALPRPQAKIKQLGAASAVLRLLLATIAASQRNHHAEPSPRVQRSIDYIKKQITTPLYVPELARVIGLSESRFKARFRREVGVPPGEHILRLKVEAACQYLALPDHSITEIAHRLGFSTSQYFATVFRRFMGTTPREFQQNATIPRARLRD